MSFINSLRKTIDKARSLPGKLGLRPYRVFVVEESWSGERPGFGVHTKTETELTVGDGYAPKVVQVSQADAVLSNGVYQAQDLRVGPLTKSYDSSGVEASDWNGATVFKVFGDGMDTNGELFTKVAEEAISAHSVTLVLRRQAKKDFSL